MPTDWVSPGAVGVGTEITINSWPIEYMRALCGYVTSTGAWLGSSHGIPNILSDGRDGPNTPFCDETKLAGCILVDPLSEDDAFTPVRIGNEYVNFYVVVPPTAAEAQWKRDVGADNSIYHLLAPPGVTAPFPAVIDSHRPCAVRDLGLRDRLEGPADNKTTIKSSTTKKKDDNNDTASSGVKEGTGTAETGATGTGTTGQATSNNKQQGIGNSNPTA